MLELINLRAIAILVPYEVPSQTCPEPITLESILLFIYLNIGDNFYIPF